MKNYYLKRDNLPLMVANLVKNKYGKIRKSLRPFFFIGELLRTLKYKIQGVKKGVNPMYTWCMDYYFLLNLYTWICAYIENAENTVDLTYHNVELEDGRTLTQIETLEIIKKEIKDIVTNEPFFKEVDDYFTRVEYIMMLWGKVLPHMWW